MDDICKTTIILADSQIPTPICNINGTESLPGGGTISGYMESMSSDSNQAAIDFVFGALGIKVNLGPAGAVNPRLPLPPP